MERIALFKMYHRNTNVYTYIQDIMRLKLTIIFFLQPSQHPRNLPHKSSLSSFGRVLAVLLIRRGMTKGFEDESSSKLE